MESIRLEKVKVKKLFERFTYDIDLRNGQDVSILIAPNGCGKTTIFKLISFIFEPTTEKYKNISTIPFEECRCVLSNGKEVILKAKKINREKKEERQLSLFSSYADEEYIMNITRSEKIEFILSIYDKKRLIQLI